MKTTVALLLLLAITLTVIFFTMNHYFIGALLLAVSIVSGTFGTVMIQSEWRRRHPEKTSNAVTERSPATPQTITATGSNSPAVGTVKGDFIYHPPTQPPYNSKGGEEGQASSK